MAAWGKQVDMPGVDNSWLPSNRYADYMNLQSTVVTGSDVLIVGGWVVRHGVWGRGGGG